MFYKKTAKKNKDSKKKMKNIWWTMKKNAWKKDAHPGENGESNADKHENRWWRVMKRISIIQDAEESNDLCLSSSGMEQDFIFSFDIIHFN